MAALPDSVRDCLRMAEDADEHLRAAEITRSIALLEASEIHGLSRQDLREALFDMAEDERFSGTELGIPGVGEFFCREAAAVLGLTPGQALDQLITLQSLKYRLPSVWEAFCEGKLWLWQAKNLETRCRKLSLDACLRVDHMIAVEVRMRPWSSVHTKIDGWIRIADPELAREEQLAESEQRYFTVEDVDRGHARVHGLVDARDAVDLEHVVSTIASALPTPILPVAADGTTLTGERAAKFRRNVRRSMALGELARQSYGQDALPTHTLVVHVDADDPALDPESSDSGFADVEAVGQLLTEDLPMFLADSKVIVKPVVDVRKLPATDRHDPPAAMRFAIQQRHPVDVFPYGTLPSAKCDLDHTVAFDADGPPGQTHVGNLGPLSRSAHRAKTFGGFQLRQPEPGIFHWTTPHGWEFIVTAEGTTKVGRPPELPPIREAPPEWLEPPEPLLDEPPPIAQQVLPGLLHRMHQSAA